MAEEKRTQITELSDSERAAMRPHAEKWAAIGLSCERADRETWTEGAEVAYQEAGYEWHGNVVWVEGPTVMAAVGPVADYCIANKISPEALDKVDFQNPVVREAAQAALRGADYKMDKRLAVTKDTLQGAVNQNWYKYNGGQFWVGGWWGIAYATFFRDECNLHLEEDVARRLEANEKMASSASYYWPHTDFTIVCERPEVIHTEITGENAETGDWGSHRLHCEDGPAIRWPDGWEVYSFHGVRVPKEVIMNPDGITVEMVGEEQNAEVRRVMIEIAGPERLEKMFTVLDEVHDDQVEIGTGEDGLPTPIGLRGAKLLSFDAGEITMYWVSLKNSTPEPDGSIKNYLIRVPPTSTTVRGAVAWTFGLEGDEYFPAIET